MEISLDNYKQNRIYIYEDQLESIDFNYESKTIVLNLKDAYDNFARYQVIFKDVFEFNTDSINMWGKSLVLHDMNIDKYENEEKNYEKAIIVSLIMVSFEKVDIICKEIDIKSEKLLRIAL